jgi:hypothetical protein
VSVKGTAATSFTLKPSAGYVGSVNGTSGGTLSGPTSKTSPITANCTVVAMFTQQGTATYTITANAGANGMISPSGTVAVAAGTTKTFTITPNPGYSLSSLGGTCSGTFSGTSYTTYTTQAITANCTLTPTFVQGSTYIITASAGTGGTLNWSGSTVIRPGSTVGIQITPNPGYMLGSINGTCPYTINSTLPVNPMASNYTLSLPYSKFTSDCSIGVVFIPIVTGATYYNVTSTTVSSSGTQVWNLGSVNPQYVAVQSGNTAQFTMAPSSGYSINNVYSSCGNGFVAVLWSGNQYTTGAITASCVVQAKFQ